MVNIIAHGKPPKLAYIHIDRLSKLTAEANPVCKNTTISDYKKIEMPMELNKFAIYKLIGGIEYRASHYTSLVVIDGIPFKCDDSLVTSRSPSVYTKDFNPTILLYKLESVNIRSVSLLEEISGGDTETDCRSESTPPPPVSTTALTLCSLHGGSGANKHIFWISG